DRNDRYDAPPQEHRSWDRDREREKERQQQHHQPVAQRPAPQPEPRPDMRPPAPVEQKKAEPPVTPPPAPAPQPVIVKSQPVKEEWIAPIIEEPIEKIQVTVITQDIVIPHEFARTLQPLPLNEYTLYIKLLLYSFSIHKNYGYLGAGLKKSVGLDELAQDEFSRLLDRLCKRGLAVVEKISEYQSTYALYLPFDPETMKKVDEKKKDEPEAEPEKAPRAKEKEPARPEMQKQPDRQQQEGRPRGGKKEEPKKGKDTGRDAKKAKEPEKKQPPKGRGRPPVKERPAPAEEPVEEMIPGRTAIHLDDDGLMKAYRTFVSMEIDKAKMRVGRSNFDKIYMEAVKYIDKKHGFKVLSDQERFREYLTQYYISAFDIPDFEAWKKAKG
ncbi:MAG TPA: hypothetical protein PKH10_09775, partial [bacterium]|nr:hypothetical protein [bacterium]